MISGISEKNRRLLDDLNRILHGPFSIKDASKIIKIPLSETRVFLAYFARKGWLSRVRQGLYITVPLGTINPSDYKESPWIVANRVFSPCYIGGWSAAEHWNLTDQLFNSVMVFTLRKFRNKKNLIQGTEYILKFTSKKYLGMTKSVWFENTKINISDPIQTIVDILDDPSIGGGIRHISDIIIEFFNSEYRDDCKIDEYIKNKKNKSIYKRLGYLIEVLGLNAHDLKEKCAFNISKGYTKLDPTIKTVGSFNRTWNLCINAGIGK